jgi:hypothetical protein
MILFLFSARQHLRISLFYTDTEPQLTLCDRGLSGDIAQAFQRKASKISCSKGHCDDWPSKKGNRTVTSGIRGPHAIARSQQLTTEITGLAQLPTHESLGVTWFVAALSEDGSVHANDCSLVTAP